LHGPYTVAELRGYATLGNVRPWTCLHSKYGDVIQFSQLDTGMPTASSAPAAAPAPMAPGTPTTANWLRAAGVAAAVAIGVMSLVMMGVWLAIAVPTMNRSQQAASDVGCLKDASVLSQALRDYALAHDGKLPEVATWREDLKPYLPDGACPCCGEVKEVGAGYELNPELAGTDLWRADDQPLLWDTGWREGLPGPHKGQYTVVFTGGATVWLPPEG